jgi:DivIVA domain-containing protein
VAAHNSSQNDEKENVSAPEAAEEAPSFNLRADVPGEIRDVSFPVAVRGYDRRAVEAYIQRVNRVIAELEVSRSPQAAVRHAVDRVSEQTKGILQQARESAEQIAAAAREEAEQIAAAAKAEAADLVVNAGAEADRLGGEAEQALADARAEADAIVARAGADADERRRRAGEEITARQEEAQARLRELQADTAAVWKERGELIADIEALATGLQQAAAAAVARFPGGRPAEPSEAPAEKPEGEPDSQPTLITTPHEPPQAPKTEGDEGW